MRKLTLSFLLIAIAVPTMVSAQPQFKALLFTKTAGWHHESINEGVDGIRKLADRHQFQVDWQEQANRISSENLKQYDVIIFLSTTGDILNEEQQKAMEEFIQSGKGFVGIHAASDTEYEWEWYTQLVGRMFEIHPANQTTRVTVLDSSFPGMERMPESYLWTDELYEFGEEKVEGLNYLMTIDESYYEVQPAWGDKKTEGMGDFHPVAWYHEFDGGRSFYTAFGHMPQTYSDNMFLEHIYGGIYWAATGKGIE
ncbi:MAG: Crp/Fnr family transcriptional regulator [Balneola sp.]|jgi:type 1 glutamine amidotransferase|nr:Crp/Fnr family transcriptional regulator [Balneola sp.]MBE80175.1 Crp/Fnr family transcriptional regulator [Balneola sp.]|tara:strand:+ start:10922 stop:11683 length:762 start_codon:yes stop_codon:yes gene_type:complete